MILVINKQTSEFKNSTPQKPNIIRVLLLNILANEIFNWEIREQDT
jgi:hypothetical protein